MTTKTKLIAAFLLGVLLGGGACAAAVYRYWYVPAASLAAFEIVETAARSAETIMTLRSVQSDDLAAVSRLLENQLTDDALTLTMAAGTSTAADRNPIICESAEAVLDYRSSHPDPAVTEARWAAIRNGLPSACRDHSPISTMARAVNP